MRFLPLLALLACGSDYEFVEVTSEGAAITSGEDATARVRFDTFEIGGKATTPLVDYLFVVDNSVSMKAVLPEFRLGFSLLAEEAEAFGKRARIAVITTLPADPEIPGALHPAVWPVEGLEVDPGFGSPVTRARIRDYKSIAGRAGRQLPFRGCTDAWFAPSDKNGKGQSCLIAHTQVGLTATGVEAGLVAFSQLLEREDFAFREGAAVNVVFVSDTHDPGINPERSDATRDLLELRPEVSELREAVLDRFGASAFRIHAIAPETVCTSEDWSAIGPVYADAARATDGVVIDICTAKDYRPLLAGLADKASRTTRPLVPLTREPAEILEVRVNGEPAAYTTHGRRIELETMPTDASEVEVRYRYE